MKEKTEDYVSFDTISKYYKSYNFPEGDKIDEYLKKMNSEFPYKTMRILIKAAAMMYYFEFKGTDPEAAFIRCLNKSVDRWINHQTEELEEIS